MYIIFDSGVSRDNGVELSCRVCGFDFAVDFLYLDHGDIVRCPNCRGCALMQSDTALFDPEQILPERRVERSGSVITVL